MIFKINKFAYVATLADGTIDERFNELAEFRVKTALTQNLDRFFQIGRVHFFGNEQLGNVNEIVSLVKLTEQLKSVAVVTIFGGQIKPAGNKETDAIDKRMMLIESAD